MRDVLEHRRSEGVATLRPNYTHRGPVSQYWVLPPCSIGMSVFCRKLLLKSASCRSDCLWFEIARGAAKAVATGVTWTRYRPWFAGTTSAFRRMPTLSPTGCGMHLPPRPILNRNFGHSIDHGNRLMQRRLHTGLYSRTSLRSRGKSTATAVAG